jgi:hypothetical protein
MPTLPVPFADIKHTVDAWHEALDEGYPAQSLQGGQPSALGITASAVGLSPSNSHGSLKNRLDIAVSLGVEVREWRPVSIEFADAQLRRYRRHDEDFREAEARFGRAKNRPAAAPSQPRRSRSDARAAAPLTHPSDRVSRTSKKILDRTMEELGPALSRLADKAPEPPPDPSALVDRVVPLLRRGGLTIELIAEKLGVDLGTAFVVLDRAKSRGISVHQRAGLWYVEAPAMGSQQDSGNLRLVSDQSGVIRLAAVGDTHLCSKYARLDCLEDFYDHVERRGVKTVLHAGNWIDGEAPFNRHDLIVHGMDQQMQYLAKHYPQRPGIATWAITGEDHEGWYSRREGIDVGRYAERVMQDNGRTDWRDVGFMENFVDLVHAGTGKSTKLLLMHPGGGSAYAVSYAPQKIVEGFDGGDKPAVLLLGHYHKSSYNLIRNVHTFQTGCFEDQTVFMRKNKLAAHLGGWVEIELTLDPETGAVIQCGGFFRNYFVRGYYKDRWSQHGPVNHAPRSA